MSINSVFSSGGLANRGRLQLIDWQRVSYTKPVNSTSNFFNAYITSGGSLDLVYRTLLDADGFEEPLPAARLTSAGLVQLRIHEYIQKASGSLQIIIDTPNVAGSLFYAPAATFDFIVQVYRLELA